MSTPPPRKPVPPAPDTETSPPPECQIAPEPNTTVNLGAFLHAARDDGFPATSLARSERPPAPAPEPATRSGPRPAVAIGVIVGAAVLVAGGTTAVVVGRAVRPRAALRVVAPAAPTGAAPAVPWSGVCTAGERRVLAHGARIAAGLEAFEAEGRLGAAVSPSSFEARAVEIDPATLAPTAVARLVLQRPVRRALALLEPDGALDVDEDDGASFTSTDGLVRVREAGADAVRGASLGGDVYGVVFRRNGGVWALTASSAGVVDGPVRLSPSGAGPDDARVGAPSVTTTRAGDVLAAWAQRASSRDAWSVRWTRWTPGGEVEPPRAWAVAGMAPAVAALPGGGALLAWTDGDGGAHAVRASVLGDDGAQRGGVIDVSRPGANAGQERVVLGPTGRGAIFFLEAEPDGRFALVARAVSCQSL